MSDIREDTMTKEPYIWTVSEYSRVGMQGFFLGALIAGPSWMCVGILIWKAATHHG